MKAFTVTETVAPLPSVLLREVARAVDSGDALTACIALSVMLPHDGNGDVVWRSTKEWLLYFLPPDGFEESWGWWSEREPRVLGILMAADIAESFGY